MFKRSGLVIACVSWAFAMPAYAGDALIEGGRLCTEQFPVQEKANNIPTHLLAAISTTESGRWHDKLGMAIPWPWTINVEGKGYYFKTKAEAIAQTQNLLAQGHQSIDVGCMQVNLKHHNRAFANLEEAFNPKTNVAYAAKFLHDNYAELGDWIKATAAYHSRTQVYGQQYLVQIEKSWNRIVAKVAAARAGMGGRDVAMTGPAPKAETVEANAQASIAEAQREMSRPASHPLTSARNVQVVKVGEGAAPVSKPKGSDVLVIRGNTSAPAPQVTATAPMRVAANTDTPLVVQPATDSVRRVTLDNPGVSSQPKDSSAGPKFVFAN